MKYSYTAEVTSSHSAQGSNNVYRGSQTSAYYNGQGNSETYEATFMGNLSEESIKKATDALQENNAFLAKSEDTAQVIFGKRLSIRISA